MAGTAPKHRRGYLIATFAAVLLAGGYGLTHKSDNAAPSAERDERTVLDMQEQVRSWSEGFALQKQVETALQNRDPDQAAALLADAPSFAEDADAFAFNILNTAAEDGLSDIALLTMEKLPYNAEAVQNAVETALQNGHPDFAENVLAASKAFPDDEYAFAFNILSTAAENGLERIAVLTTEKLPYDADSVQNAVEVALQNEQPDFAEALLAASRSFADDDGAFAFNILAMAGVNGLNRVAVLTTEKLPYDGDAVQYAVEAGLQNDHPDFAAALLTASRSFADDKRAFAFNILVTAGENGLNDIALLTMQKLPYDADTVEAATKAAKENGHPDTADTINQAAKATAGAEQKIVQNAAPGKPQNLRG
ncbi:MAG: hypothetical protein HND56_11030 [Pseudomonadota bacterium]|nr:hypothetical protein [Pseudomonadota bacterium]QKK06187.1 MAG: hypothetical protein HND56_11030 [Pseudomonadota bacterium]